MLGSHVDDPADALRALDDLEQLVADVGVGRLPQQEAPHLPGQDGGDDRQEEADGDAPRGVEPWISGHQGEAHAAEGEGQPHQGAEVLQQDHRKLRDLGMPDEIPPREVPPRPVRFPDGHPEGRGLEPDRHDEDTDRPLG